MDISNLCLGCMRTLEDGATECPHCKFDNASQNAVNYLPLRTVLENRYVVGKVISVNGEGVTYMGYDTELEMAVRIREYFPANLCERVGTQVQSSGENATIYDMELAEFLKLARNLARMRSLSALLPVYDIFEANNTAYYISETIESITLRDFLIRNGGSLDYEQIRSLFMPIMQTLSSLHQVDIIHRGISPDTLIIGKDGKVRLTEFCVADARTARSPMTAQLFKGYAAIEQYGFESAQGAWTDVYSLAATIYRSLVGSPPPEATARVTNDKMIIPASVADSLSAYVMSGLANALQILPEERTDSIETFRDEISATPTVVTKAAERTRGSSRQQKPKNKNGNSKKYIIITAAVTVAALIIVCIILLTVFSNHGNSDEQETTTAAPTTTIPYSEFIIDPDAGETPTLTGMTYAELMDTNDAELLLAIENYDIVVTSKQYSDSRVGEIIKQTPAAGETIHKDDKIKLVLSLGPAQFDMPDIAGKTKDEAYIALLEAGFAKDNITFAEKSSKSDPSGTVIDFSPSAGKSVTADIYVTVYINSYVPPTTDPAEQFTYSIE